MGYLLMLVLAGTGSLSRSSGPGLAPNADDSEWVFFHHLGFTLTF